MLLPGGFGTLDEAFELLTLLQTGKAQPAPVVLLDMPGGTYWAAWLEFVEARARPPGLRLPDDDHLLLRDRRRRGGGRRDRRLLRQLPLAAVRRRSARAAAAAGAAAGGAARPERASSPTSACAARSSVIDARTAARDRRRRPVRPRARSRSGSNRTDGPPAHADRPAQRPPLRRSKIASDRRHVGDEDLVVDEAVTKCPRGHERARTIGQSSARDGTVRRRARSQPCVAVPE